MKDFLKNVDIFDKAENAEFTQSTQMSMIMSNSISMLSSFLMFAQIILAVSPMIHRDLLMTSTPAEHSELVNISVNVLVNLPCELLHFDVMDSIGLSALNSTIRFRRMSDTNGFIGNYEPPAKEKCFPCFGIFPNSSCCNGCKRLKELYKMSNMTAEPEKWPQCQPENKQKFSEIEKCQVKGKISVSRVRGMFHIAPGRNVQSNNSLNHEFNDDYPSLNMQHTLFNIRFGPNIPTASNPLRGMVIRGNPNAVATAYRYVMMVTPVVFYADGEYIEKGFEYTAMITTIQFQDRENMYPGLFFQYSFTPYTISVTWQSRSFRAFLISTGGLLAGVYSIFSLVYDAIERRLKKKEEDIKKKQEEVK